jgi:hypothetical protein
MANLTDRENTTARSEDEASALDLLKTIDLASGVLWRPASSLRNRRGASAVSERSAHSHAAM